MILEVQHETRLSYSAPVTEAVAEVRVEPASNADQSCRSFALTIYPATETFRYQDGLGNGAHHFNVLAPHQEVRILAASVVETHPRPRELTTYHIRYPLDLDGAELDVLDFLKLRGPLRPTPRLLPLLERLRPQQGTPLGEVVLRVSEHIHRHYEYAPDVTLANSPIDDVLEQGKGVCQDFTHLMLAILRSFGIPARYVSGYLWTGEAAPESDAAHAWAEAFVEDLGWVGFDPANRICPTEAYIRMSIGLDYWTAAPIRGVRRGTAAESLAVKVKVTQAGAEQ